jgi:hypothetical protein
MRTTSSASRWLTVPYGYNRTGGPYGSRKYDHWFSGASLKRDGDITVQGLVVLTLKMDRSISFSLLLRSRVPKIDWTI